MEKNFNLLIANDNEEESKLICEKLTKDNSSYMIEITKSGKEAIDFVKAKEYDIVVLDLVLEGSDGFEVIETIKNANYKSKIIVITSLCSETFMNKAISMGVDYYILKPISIDVLSKRIKDLIAPQKIKVAGGLSMLTAREVEERIQKMIIEKGRPAVTEVIKNVKSQLRTYVANNAQLSPIELDRIQAKDPDYQLVRDLLEKEVAYLKEVE